MTISSLAVCDNVMSKVTEFTAVNFSAIEGSVNPVPHVVHSLVAGVALSEEAGRLIDVRPEAQSQERGDKVGWVAAIKGGGRVTCTESVDLTEKEGNHNNIAIDAQEIHYMYTE